MTRRYEAGCLDAAQGQSKMPPLWQRWQWLLVGRWSNVPWVTIMPQIQLKAGAFYRRFAATIQNQTGRTHNNHRPLARLFFSSDRD